MVQIIKRHWNETNFYPNRIPPHNKGFNLTLFLSHPYRVILAHIYLLLFKWLHIAVSVGVVVYWLFFGRKGKKKQIYHVHLRFLDNFICISGSIVFFISDSYTILLISILQIISHRNFYQLFFISLFSFVVWIHVGL